MEAQDEPYDFMISRAPVQDDQDDGEIPLAEWEQLLAVDASLEAVPYVPGRHPLTGEALQVRLEGGARWTAHPDGASPLFWWHFGKVVCYSVDETTLSKARELAEKLRAQCIVSSNE